ncbi:TPA: SIR2 family protein, partial [Raoultella ornithinolytica]|nr:SIR2 family protein [Raoultella ornithinolytica]
MEEINLIKEIRELKSQLSYAKNIGFFMGAGTSCALGLPNISQLTVQVESALTEPLLDYFNVIKTDLSKPDETISIEDILNQIRRIREITEERPDREFLGVSGINARDLDVEICKNIYNIITEKEADANLTAPKKFFAWLNMQNR